MQERDDLAEQQSGGLTNKDLLPLALQDYNQGDSETLIKLLWDELSRVNPSNGLNGNLFFYLCKHLSMPLYELALGQGLLYASKREIRALRLVSNESAQPTERLRLKFAGILQNLLSGTKFLIVDENGCIYTSERGVPPIKRENIFISGVVHNNTLFINSGILYAAQKARAVVARIHSLGVEISLASYLQEQLDQETIENTGQQNQGHRMHHNLGWDSLLAKLGKGVLSINRLDQITSPHLAYAVRSDYVIGWLINEFSLSLTDPNFKQTNIQGGALLAASYNPLAARSIARHLERIISETQVYFAVDNRSVISIAQSPLHPAKAFLTGKLVLQDDGSYLLLPEKWTATAEGQHPLEGGQGLETWPDMQERIVLVAARLNYICNKLASWGEQEPIIRFSSQVPNLSILTHRVVAQLREEPSRDELRLLSTQELIQRRKYALAAQLDEIVKLISGILDERAGILLEPTTMDFMQALELASLEAGFYLLALEDADLSHYQQPEYTISHTLNLTISFSSDDLGQEVIESIKKENLPQRNQSIPFYIDCTGNMHLNELPRYIDQEHEVHPNGKPVFAVGLLSRESETELAIIVDAMEAIPDYFERLKLALPLIQRYFRAFNLRVSLKIINS